MEEIHYLLICLYLVSDNHRACNLVTSVIVYCVTREPRGFGFVKFRYAEDAAEAKQQMNHTVIGGREIRIVFAEENRKTPHEMRVSERVSDRVRYDLLHSPFHWAVFMAFVFINS